MSDVIKIKKGLDLPLSGAAELKLADSRSIRRYAVKPTDFVGLMPRLLVQEGDEVKVGSPLICDKKDTRIVFTSPVQGKVVAVVRGEKRALLAVVVEASAENQPTTVQMNSSDAESVKNAMLQTGLWTALRQRPFGTVASPDSKPKAIFVSAFDSAPLAVDVDFALQGREADFSAGIEALSRLTAGKLHVSFRHGQKLEGAVAEKGNIVKHIVDGPHPAGLIGTQIAAIDPINKGEVVWTMNPQDVATLGHLVIAGEYRPERVVAVAGPQVGNAQYHRIIAGASMETIIAGLQMGANPEGNGFRYISGNVLSGTQIAADGFIGAYDSQLSVLPEGDHYDFMGWLFPKRGRFSFSRTFLSGFTARCSKKCGRSNFDTNLHGGVRPFIFTGAFEQVFPMDIYPLHLIKACIVGDIELMEKLGIYEVEPEDFALCEFVDVSKTEIQFIVRQALEQLRKEAM